MCWERICSSTQLSVRTRLSHTARNLDSPPNMIGTKSETKIQAGQRKRRYDVLLSLSGFGFLPPPAFCAFSGLLFFFLTDSGLGPFGLFLRNLLLVLRFLCRFCRPESAWEARSESLGRMSTIVSCIGETGALIAGRKRLMQCFHAH